MKRMKEISIGDRVVTVRELTVSEVRAWFKDLSGMRDNSIDLVNEALMADASLGDMVRMSNITMDDLDNLTPSQIETLLAVCREVNPHFFQLRHRLSEAARVMPSAVNI
ncbi:MAG: phage tail assembly protein [Nitrospirae bacterium]|nr:phage tail assembly protein [Magnetococcales bacterium]